MIARLLVATSLLCFACGRKGAGHQAPPAPSVSASASASAPAPLVLGPAASSARAEERERALFQLLESGRASALPVVATEPGKELDRKLRESLLTVEVPRIRAAVVLGTVSVVGGEVPNAARDVAHWKAGLRSCYQRELDKADDLTGKVQVSVRVAQDGTVTGVKAIPSGRLSSAVVNCVKSLAARTKFEAPTGGTPEIRVTVEFKKGG